MRLLSLLIFCSKLTFCLKLFQVTIRVSNKLDPDQDQHSVGPDLGSKCLQWLPADNKAPLVVKELSKQHSRWTAHLSFH